MPPPKRGQPYYDVDRGRLRIVPPDGGKPVDYAGPSERFDAGRALKRAGVQTLGVGRQAVDDAARAAQTVAERQPFDLGAAGGFLITAAASLLGLLFLDLLLSKPAATEGALGLLGRAINALVDPSHTLIVTRPKRSGKVSASGPEPVPGLAEEAARVDKGLGPLTGKVGGFAVIGRPGAGTHSYTESPDNWQSDKAVDLATPLRTPVYAPFAGRIGDRVGYLGSILDTGRFAGQRVTVEGTSDAAYLAHLLELAPGVVAGALVKAGQLIGWTGRANNVPHLHVASEQGNPYAVAQAAITGKGQ